MPTLLINDFSGGLNTRFRQNQLAPGETTNTRNCRYTLKGALTKRFGSSLVALSSAGTVGVAFSVYAYTLTGMSAEAMLVVVRESPGNVLRTTNGTSFTSVFSMSGLDLTAQNFPIHFATFGDLVYLFADYMDTRSWDNSSATTITASTTNFPRARHAVVFKNRVFTGYIYDGSATRRSRVKWSNFGNAANGQWGSTNFEDIYANDGTVISGMIAYGDELIVFKGPEFASQSFMHSKMFRIQGDTFDATNVQYSIDEIPLPPGVGLLSPDGMAIYQGRLIFLTNDGFYKYVGGGAAPIRISEKIQDDMNDLSVSTFTEFDSIAAAFVYRNRFYCSVRSTDDSSEGYNNRMYILDGDAWWMDIISGTADDYATGDGTGIQFTRFLGNIYMIPPTSHTIGGNVVGVVRRIEIDDQFTENIANDAAANVNSSYTTKEFDFGKEVNLEDCYVHFRRQSSGTLTFKFNTDQRGAVSNSIDMTTPDTGTPENTSSSVLKKRINIARQAKTVQFEIHDRSNNDFEVYAIELNYRDIRS